MSPLLFTCTSSLPPLVDPSFSSLSSFVCHSHPTCIFLSLFKLHPHSYKLYFIFLSTSLSSSFLPSCPAPLSSSFLLPLSSYPPPFSSSFLLSCPPPLHRHSYCLVHLPFHSHSYSLYLLVHLPFHPHSYCLVHLPFILIPTVLSTSPSSSFLLSCPPPLSFSFLLPLSSCPPPLSSSFLLSCPPPLHPHSYCLVHLPFHPHFYSLCLLVHFPFHPLTLASSFPLTLPSHFILIPTSPCHVNLHPSPYLISYLQVCFQEEHSVTTLFPEFQDISSSVTYMDILVSGTQRITAFGCQNGYIRCVQTDLTNNSKLKDQSSIYLTKIQDFS